MNENKNTANLPCEVVQDLLPLYHDGLVSEKTAKAVDSHLEGCGNCRKEYELIRVELPGEHASESTGQRFAAMMKKLRLRRIMTVAVAVILTCAVLAGGFYGLTQVPLRQLPAGNVSVERAYLYEDAGETRLFFHYRVPAWTGPTFLNMVAVKTAESGVWALECEYKTAIISSRFKETDRWEGVWDLEINAAYEDVKSITFEGEVIWNAQSAKPVPDYVQAHRDFLENQILYDGMTLDADKNLIGFDSAENNYYIYWDLDGNLLYEGDGASADEVIDFDLPDSPPVTEE